METLGTFLNDNEIFAAIETIEPFPFLVGEASNLQLITHINYGNKPLFNGINGVPVSDIAKYIVLTHKESWLSYVEMAALKQALNDSETVDEVITDSENTTGTKNDTNKVSSFNESTLIDDTGMDSSTSEDVNKDRTRLLTREDVKPIIKYRLLNETRKDTIIKKVVEDIVNSLTIPIY